MSSSKITKLYYSISEVSKLTDLKQYVLRYWETEFNSLKPKKNRSGNRNYKQSDIDLIERIKHLLYIKKYTIQGAREKINNKKIIKNHKIDHNSNEYKILLDRVLIELKSILENI